MTRLTTPLTFDQTGLDAVANSVNSIWLFDDDFSGGLDSRINPWNGGSRSVTGGVLEIVSSDGNARGINVNGGFEVGKTYTIEFSLDLGDADYFHIFANWPPTQVQRFSREFRKSGVHRFAFVATTNTIKMAVRLDTTGTQATASLDWLRITPGGDANSTANNTILLGDGSYDTSPSYADGSLQDGNGNVVLSPYGGVASTNRVEGIINIGRGATVSDSGGSLGNNAVNIGAQARRVVDATYDPTATDGDSVSIGYGSQAFSWRGVAIGPLSLAGATSSTAVGANAIATGSHNVALGRGAWCPGTGDIDLLVDQPRVVLGGGLHAANSNVDIYFGTTWANRFPATMPQTDHTGMTNITVADRTTPADDKIRLHGPDSYDTENANTSEGGGSLCLVGGLSTGTAAGGSVDIEISPAGTVDNNVKNAPVVVGRFDSAPDSAAENNSRFMLWDRKTGSLKRVRFGEDNSAGRGLKYLCVDN